MYIIKQFFITFHDFVHIMKKSTKKKSLTKATTFFCFPVQLGDVRWEWAVETVYSCFTSGDVPIVQVLPLPSL